MGHRAEAVTHNNALKARGRGTLHAFLARVRHDQKCYRYSRTPICGRLPSASLCVRRIDKRAKYSRRRAYNDDADIDYINERNAKFNKKAERFYGKYTAEIKQNLERGTAV